MPGWLAALREAFALDARIGAVFGPHLPAAGHEPDDRPRADRVLRHVRPRRRRAARLRPRRPDVPLQRERRLPPRVLGGAPLRRRPYSEDQAFGRALAAHPRWRKAYAPASRRAPRARLPAAGVHAPLLRRVPRPARDDRARRADRRALHRPRRRGLVARDRRWMREQGWPRATVARWTGARRVVHHTGRKVFSALGSRARTRCPRPCSARCRWSGRADAPPRRSPPAPPCPRARTGRRAATRTATRRSPACWRDGPAPLLEPVPGHGRPRAAPHRVRDPAVLDRLRRAQHHLPARAAARADGPHLLDLAPRPVRRPQHDGRPSMLRRESSSTSRRCRRRCSAASATGTAPTSRSRPAGRRYSRCSSSTACRARAYLVNDHEPEFYATSVESVWAAETYRPGPLRHRRQPVAARTLRRALRRHGRRVPVRRRPRRLLPAAGRAPRDDTVVFYARAVTPRRAVALGDAGARRSCSARRPDVRIVLFGDREPLATPFPYEHTGVATPRAARVGVLRGDRRPLPVADQLLADPAGDARLRAPVRRPRGRQREFGVRRATARSSSRRSTPTRSPTRSSGCSTTARARAPLGGGREFVRAAHLGRGGRAGRAGAADCAPGARGRMTTAAHATRRTGSGRSSEPRRRGGARPRRWSRCSRRRSCSRSPGRSSRRRSRRRTSSPTSATSSRSRGPGLPGQAGRPLFSTEQQLAAVAVNADQAAAQPT